MKIAGQDVSLNSYISSVQAHCEGIQNDMNKILTSSRISQIDFKSLEIKELYMSPIAFPDNKKKFYWLTEADREQLSLTGPLRLKEIRTKGVPNSYLSAI